MTSEELRIHFARIIVRNLINQELAKRSMPALPPLRPSALPR